MVLQGARNQKRSGLIIERPILELLNITKDTPLETTTDGEALIIHPVKRHL